MQSQSVLTRPYCLLEILTAMDAGVPIVGVALCKHAFPYCFEGALALLESLDTSLGDVSPGADVFLTDHGTPSWLKCGASYLSAAPASHGLAPSAAPPPLPSTLLTRQLVRDRVRVRVRVRVRFTLNPNPKP